ncbi:MAG: hypothetical protein RLY93_19180 [Sumerlaeia bacterium]
MAWLHRSRASRRRFLKEFRENPVLAREGRMLRRGWLQWLLIVAGVWLPVALLTRVFLYTLTGGAMAGLPLVLLMVVDTLGLVFRPDIFLGFFVVYRMAANEGWEQMREPLALTFLGERQIAVSKFAVPFALLAGLNLLAAPFYYWQFFATEQYFVPIERWGIGEISTGALLVPFAVCEDIFFAALVVLVAMNAYLFRHQPLWETIKGVGVMALVGLAASLASLVTLFIPVQWYLSVGRHWGWVHLMENAVFFAVVFPVQWLLILYFWRRTVRNLGRWLHEEPGGGGG